jgi:hypothetical protein
MLSARGILSLQDNHPSQWLLKYLHCHLTDFQLLKGILSYFSAIIKCFERNFYDYFFMFFLFFKFLL